MDFGQHFTSLFEKHGVLICNLHSVKVCSNILVSVHVWSIITQDQICVHVSAYIVNVHSKSSEIQQLGHLPPLFKNIAGG